MEYFKKNDKVPLRIGGFVTIVDKLGEGGQGVVYKVSMNGKDYALKWYKEKKCRTQSFYDNIENNIIKGAPSNSFLWPIVVTEWRDGSFGYIMDMRPNLYKNFSDFLLARAKFTSLSALLNAVLQITYAFRELHRKGYSYQDLNDGNFFINPQTGDVLICDNDNVAPYGINLGIGGKSRYMAPEVVVGKIKPNDDTDRFSLSVILFLLLFGNHPLEGKFIASIPCLTEEFEKRFYGEEAVFIFDPNNDKNRPVTGIHTNAIKRWPAYPQFIRDEFIFAFSQECLKNPHNRKPENEWQKVFVKLRDKTVKCSCGAETFIDENIPESICNNCKKKLPKPLFLQTGKYNVALYPEQKIYACHTQAGSDDFKNITGEVIKNKNNSNLWGVRNLSDSSWILTLPDGNIKEIKKNEVVPIFKEVNINFQGGNKGIIVH